MVQMREVSTLRTSRATLRASKPTKAERNSVESKALLPRQVGERPVQNQYEERDEQREAERAGLEQLVVHAPELPHERRGQRRRASAGRRAHSASQPSKQQSDSGASAHAGSARLAQTVTRRW
jgi:hypothetical protein